MPMKVGGKTPACVNITTRTIKKNTFSFQEILSIADFPQGKRDNPVTPGGVSRDEHGHTSKCSSD